MTMLKFVMVYGGVAFMVESSTICTQTTEQKQEFRHEPQTTKFILEVNGDTNWAVKIPLF